MVPLFYISSMSLLNRVIDNLGIELHIPGYKFCGPGTKLQKRLARGDKPRNSLDEACLAHDLSYNKSHDLKDRHKADTILKNQAWERVKASDTSLGERIAALGVTAAMKGKLALGMGHKRKKHRKTPNKRHKTSKKHTPFSKMVQVISNTMQKHKPTTVGAAIRIALKKAKSFKRKNKVFVPRVITLKKGGFLPFLIPLLSGLGALGTIGGAAANIATAVTKAKQAQKNLEEAKRHNEKMEAIAIGKGLYLAPYKQGCGLYLNPYKGCGVAKKN